VPNRKTSRPTLFLGAVQPGFLHNVQVHNAALIAGDGGVVDALLADDSFYNQGGGGSVTKAAFLDYMKAGEAEVKKAVRDDTKIQLYGDVAVITGITQVDVTLKGEEKVLHSRYLHVWAKKGDNWKLVARQAT
jgi:ketosteroid isomerase-like protein